MTADESSKKKEVVKDLVLFFSRHLFALFPNIVSLVSRDKQSAAKM